MPENWLMNVRIVLRSSVAHNGETVGVDAEFHRVKIMLPSGLEERIPTITGNSIRGQLRDAAADDLLTRLEGGALALDKFYLLFSGGSLSKTGGRSLNLDDIRELRRLVPMLSIWGGAVGNHIMPGKLIAGQIMPVAEEAAHLLPAGVVTGQPPSVYSIMQTESYTRMDDAKSERHERWHGNADAAPDAPAQQMRYNVETMAAGTVLFWRVGLLGATALEREAFIAALRRWAVNPVLGGKSSVGHGLVEMQFENGWRIAPDGVDLPDTPAYDAHIQEHADAIRFRLYV